MIRNPFVEVPEDDRLVQDVPRDPPFKRSSFGTCSMCDDSNDVDEYSVCAGCYELNTCPMCKGFTRYTVVDQGGAGVARGSTRYVCSHCEPEEFKWLDDKGQLL